MEHFFSRQVASLMENEPEKAQLLRDEIGVVTYEDLITYFPFRYEDRSKHVLIKDIVSTDLSLSLQGRVKSIKRDRKDKKLTVIFSDDTGSVELVWFKKFTWLTKSLKPYMLYRIWGKPSFTKHGKIQFVHPELSAVLNENKQEASLHPIYRGTEKLKKNKLDSKGIAQIQKRLLNQLDIEETLSDDLLQRYKLVSLKEAFTNIHFPRCLESLRQARRRLKFEELFFIQLRLLKTRQVRVEKQESKTFSELSLFHEFYNKYLPFKLTEDQKKAIKDIYHDFVSGKQMNRFLQGDVGSGKTIVAFLSMLIVIGSGAQVAIMAPTEVLAKQHYMRFCTFAQQLKLNIALLTGSTKKKERDYLLYQLKSGLLHIVVGTHALLGDNVSFHELGFFIVDEQHRFGVAQRAGLLSKNKNYIPHVLIMTATPIPRTLAMTFYGDLDLSTMYQLPEGRKPIKTQHYYESSRLRVFKFLKDQLALGRQIYIVYPLIEESSVLDYDNLLAGYESIQRAFPETPIGIIHGRMNPADKDMEMQQFANNQTKILVSTTVIEVGINVPNATVMVIESAERFGLAQLHQLRGRVGRGSEQSYCMLITSRRLNKISKARIASMVKTNSGFELAELDLQLRGPGDLMGLQQSGSFELKIADLKVDIAVLEEARLSAKRIVADDPNLEKIENLPILREYNRLLDVVGNWGMVG